jgi:hypothetical protein
MFLRFVIEFRDWSVTNISTQHILIFVRLFPKIEAFNAIGHRNSILLFLLRVLVVRPPPPTDEQKENQERRQKEEKEKTNYDANDRTFVKAVCTRIEIGRH